MDRRIDLVIAFCFMCFGLFMIWHATGIKLGLSRDPIGPRAFFYGCGAVMGGGGAWLVVTRFLRWRKATEPLIEEEGTGDEPGHPSSAPRAFAIMALCFAYALILKPLGFLIATPIFIVAALLMMRQRNYLGIAAIALLFTAITYVVFAQILGVRLPVGPFTDLFRELGWIIL